MKSHSRLFICPTPIGNLEDVTLRVLKVLKEVDLIAAEDTRTTRKLLSRYQIQTQLTSYHEHNKIPKARKLLSLLKQDKKIALVSEAGMPGLSDPGYHLIKLVLESDIDIEALPGPSASLTALVASGLPTDSFIFVGFLPKKKGKRQSLLNELKGQRQTLIIYESPHRIKVLLSELKSALGNRKAALLRELTKKFEQTLRGKLSDIIRQTKNRTIKGEIVLVVEGNREKSKDVDKATIIKEVKSLIKSGENKKEAIKKVATKYGLPKRDVYQAALKIDAKP